MTAYGRSLPLPRRYFASGAYYRRNSACRFGKQLAPIGQAGSLPPLEAEPLEEVLQIELRKVQARVGRATYRSFLFRISEEARQFLLAEGTDQRYGARHPNRAIERFLIHPIARLLTTDQLLAGGRLLIDLHPAKNCLAFPEDTEHYLPYVDLVLENMDPVRRTSAELQA